MRVLNGRGQMDVGIHALSDALSTSDQPNSVTEKDYFVPSRIHKDYLPHMNFRNGGTQDSGTETLELNGKVIPCHWTRIKYSERANSDSVPGGMVMSMRGGGAGYYMGADILQPSAIENLAALAGPPAVLAAIKSANGAGPFAEQMSLGRAAAPNTKARNLGSGGAPNLAHLAISVDYAVAANGNHIPLVTNEFGRTVSAAGSSGARVPVRIQFGSIAIGRSAQNTVNGIPASVPPQTRITFMVSGQH